MDGKELSAFLSVVVGTVILMGMVSNCSIEEAQLKDTYNARCAESYNVCVTQDADEVHCARTLEHCKK